MIYFSSKSVCLCCTLQNVTYTSSIEVKWIQLHFILIIAISKGDNLRCVTTMVTREGASTRKVDTTITKNDKILACWRLILKCCLNIENHNTKGFLNDDGICVNLTTLNLIKSKK